MGQIRYTGIPVHDSHVFFNEEFDSGTLITSINEENHKTFINFSVIKKEGQFIVEECRFFIAPEELEAILDYYKKYKSDF